MTFLEAIGVDRFIQLALVSALIGGAVCGLVGPLMYTRRLSSATGGIAHAVVGGIGFMIWLGGSPLIGALLAALAVAIILALGRPGQSDEADAHVQILWSTGMALGVLFISLTPGYRVDLMSYLFGNLLVATTDTLILASGVLVAALVFLCTGYRSIEAFCFDEEFATVVGVKVRRLNLAMYLLIALSVVVLIQSVGLILVLSLMTIPSATVAPYARSLLQMLIMSIVLNWVISFGGLWLSYAYDLPTGSTIILLAASVFIGSRVLSRLLVKS
jgi:zinc transport system permease protein